MLKFASSTLGKKAKKALAVFLAVIISFSVFMGINPFNFLVNASEKFSSAVVYSSDFSQNDASTWKMANSANAIADGKLSLKSSAADSFSSAAIRTEEAKTQFVRAVFNTGDFSNSRPVIWARASYLEAGKNESLVGYYLAFEGASPVLYKREKVGDTYKDTCLAYCGNITWDGNKEYTLEIDVTGTNEAAVINVRVYKSTSLALQARQTFVDTTNPIVKGGAGVSLKATAANATGKFDKFDYYSTDDVNEYYVAYENGVKTGVSFVQSIAINKDTEYTLSVEIAEADAYEPLVISYATASSTGKHILAQIKDCTVNKVNGKNIYSYTFKLADQGGTIYYDYGYRNAAGSSRTTPVFVGFRQSDATVKNRYSNFELREKKTDGSFGPNLLVNGDFKLGLYGWSDDTDLQFNSSFGYSLFGDVSSKNSSRVKLDGPIVDIVMDNTYYKLTKDKKLNITYLGGSVTSGHGASDVETTSWRGLTTKWFKDNYPNATISSKNGAVGSTGSHLAVYQYGLIDYHKTDLLFVDSAINDYYLYNNQRNGKANPESVDAYNNTLRNIESLIRNARAENPNMDIVLVLTFDHWRVTDDSNPSVKAMIDLAKKYKLPCIDLRIPLKARADADGLQWNSEGLKPYRTENDTDAYEQLYLKGDGVHPNDAGYKIFGDYANEILKGYMDGAKAKGLTELKDNSITVSPISDFLLDNPTVITADKITLASGWTHAAKNFSYLHSQYANVYENKGVVTTSTPNSTLSYTFKGTEFGIFAAVGADCGQIYVEVDGVPYKQGKNGDFADGVIDLYQNNNDHRTQLIATGLENTNHTVTIKSLAGANGNRIEIGAYFVNAAPAPDYSINTTKGTTSDAIPTTQNIINGKKVTESYASAFAHTTDGKNVEKGAGSTGWPYKLTYDLGQIYNLNEIQIISGTGSSRLGGFELYVSENKDSLYNAENLVATYTGEHIDWASGATTIDTVTFKENYASGSFLGVKLTKANPASVTGASYVNEIIVKGNAAVVPVPNYTVSASQGTTSDTLPTTENVIYNKTVTENYSATFAHLTDGRNAGKGAGGSGWPYKLSYVLGEEYNISEIKVISGTNQNRLGAFEVYVSDKADDLYEAKNLKATVTGAHVDWVTNGTTIDTVDFVADYAVGSYLGIKLTKCNPSSVTGASFIHEIIVKGEKTIVPIPDWTVNTTYGTTNDPIDKTNLIYGINPDENGGTVVRWTDGVNKALEAGMTKLSFPLVNKATINKIKITSQNGYGSKTSRPKAYDIYIADNFADLYKPENKVATFSTNTTAKDYRTEIDTFEFTESYAKKGKYIGFHFTEPNVDAVSGKIYINEIEVFGKEDIANYTVTTTTHKTNEYTIDKSSIIYGINPDENGSTVTRWTDGEKTCLPAGMTKLSFPLVEKSTINKVRVISQNGYTSKASRVAAYDIYIADTFADLYKPENKVASFSTNSTATDYVAAIDTFEFASKYAKEGKYIGFHITKTDNAGLNKIHINEIEVFGTGSGSGGQGGEPQLGTRPTLPNVDKNFEYKEGTSSVNGDRDLFGNVVLKGEAHTSQYVALDYAYVSGMAPVVWAKAIKSTDSNASVTGYYAYINGASTELYKRTSDGTDTRIGICGNHDGYSGRIVRLEIVTEKVGNATKITVTAYKSGTGKDADKMFLMTKNTIFDETAELQNPGYAGYSVKGVGKTAEIKGFNYSSSDGTADTLSYIENPVTPSSSGIAGQKVILDPAKTYTLTARVSQTNTSLAIYYWATPGKMEKAFASVGTVSNVGGYRTVTYEFCLNDIIAENGLAAPYADLHAYNKMSEVFVGFVTDKANVISYSNLSLKEKVSGREILTNQNLKMGLLGFAEVIENSKWAFEVGTYGATSSRLGRLTLKTNVSQVDYDKIFKMATGENTGIDYSKYDKLMLHINGTGGDYGKVGQFFELEIGASYVYEVDFGYDPRNSATPIIFYHTVENGKINSNPATRIEPSSKLSKDGCRTQYIFTVPDKAYKNPETGKATIFVGVSTGKAEAKCYFYDFVLYNEKDTTKTNLFLNGKFEDGFKYWIVNHNYVWSVLTPVSIKTYTQPGTGVELLPYDAAKFQLDDGSFVLPDIPDVDYNNYKGDFMIYIPETVTDTYGKFGQVLYFEKNVKYQFTMSFKYIRQNSTKPVVLYYKDDPYASNDYIISKGYVTAKGEADRVQYLTKIRDTVTFDLIMDDANSRQTVEFKAPADAWKNSEGKSPIFVGLSSGEKGTKCYFANFCVAKEGSKENMLLNADFKQGFLNWICNYGYLINPITQEDIFWTNGYTIAQILPYDANIFVNDTNDGLWSDGDWYSIFGEDDKATNADGTDNENSGSENVKKEIIPGKINIPATVALYGGIAVVLAAAIIIILLAKKKKKQQA